ncbi:uncharacterized protein LOC142638892 [Castanea sativa]|uniref:uncharacterized protein LOC142638892 n=1 Tax=Castanea sativa TaxID=21020 RepID=UPI003F64F98C
MDGDASNHASGLPWIWVIETLASFKQVDVSFLHDLIELAPDLDDDLGKNMREMLALRCLESLCGPSNEVNNGHSKVGFDFSESCEDVLQHIMHENSLSDLEMPKPELVKRDLRPFIIHKRACMPKLALQQLKSILEGIHPYADCLKDRSGLEFTSAGGGIPVNNGSHNALTHRVDGSFLDTQQMGVKGNLIPRMLENENKLLEKDPCNGNLLLSKRGRNESATENIARDFRENQNILNDCDDIHLTAKKQKQCDSSGIHSIEENPVPLHRTEPLEDSSARVMPVIERQVCDLAKDQIGTLKEGRVLEDGQDERTASVRCGHNSEDEFHHNQSKPPDSATMMRSQCTYSHDSLASAGSTDQKLCMRCNEGGQLLVCNTSNCPVMVHENCLGFSPRFENNGNFYCPYCAYSLAISEYLEAKKKVSYARKELAKLFQMGFEASDKGSH